MLRKVCSKNYHIKHAQSEVFVMEELGSTHTEFCSPLQGWDDNIEEGNRSKPFQLSLIFMYAYIHTYIHKYIHKNT